MANRFLNNITINDAYTFPPTDGSDGQAIITDGAGNLSFGSATVNLANTAVTPGTYGDSSNIPTITVDQKGRITSASETAVSIPAGTTIGTAGNEVSGTVTLQGSGDTTVTQSGQTITIASTSGGGGGYSREINNFTISDSTTSSLTLTLSQPDENYVDLFIDGVYQSKLLYSATNNILNLNSGVFPNGSSVEAIIINGVTPPTPTAVTTDSITVTTDDTTITTDNN